ncbi:MAG: hypothetical protein JW797_03635 [Bradymonadales bacterium]|nr:hypothetical protein [Bradymonadales bacterium]
MPRIRLEPLVVLLAVPLFLTACTEPLDLTRPTMERGTLGEELFAIFLRDLRRSPDQAEAKAAAFLAQEEHFVRAIDTMIPADQGDAVKGFLLDLLPLWDDDSLPDLIRKVAFVLEEVQSSEPLLAAWSRTLKVRRDFLHPDATVALLDRVARFDRLSDLATVATDLVREHDGLSGDGQPALEENDIFRRLLLSARDRLLDPADPADRYRTMVLLSELLLQEDLRFAAPSDPSQAWAVRLDLRGLAAVARTDQGSLNYLFRDDDGDDLADIDAEGLFGGSSGQPFWVAPFGTPFRSEAIAPGVVVFRDDLGRARDPRDDLIYQYVDLNWTAVGYLVRRLPDLVGEGLLSDLSKGLDGLLGELDRSGEFPRFTAATPLLDLTDAAFELLDFDWLPELAEGLAILLTDHEELVATLLLVIQDAGDIVEEIGCQMEPDNALVDDVLPYLDEAMATEGLLAALLEGMEDPVFAMLFEAMDDLMSYSKQHIAYIPDSPYFQAADLCLATTSGGTLDRYHCLRTIPRDEIFEVPTDHDAVTGPASISLSQRLVHLIYVASETPYQMVIESVAFSEDGEPFIEDLGPIIWVPDTAASFFDSVVGNFCLIDYVNMELFEQDELLSSVRLLAELLGLAETEGDFAELVVDIVVTLSDQIGVHLDECPTANQTLRFFNLPEYVIRGGPLVVRLAPPLDGEGFVFSHNVVDSLIAAEAVGALEALYPLLKPLSDRELTPLLGRMVGDMYRYYPEPSQSYQIADGTWADLPYSGMRRYEPALVQIFRDDRLAPTLVELAGALLSVPLSIDKPFHEVIQELAARALTPGAGLANRRGETTALRGDGQPTPMTRFYLLKGALDALDQAVQADPETEAAWERAADTLVDLLLELEEDAEGRGHFADRGGPALGSVAAAHAHRQTSRLREEGVFHQKMQADYPQYFEDLLTSRGFAALVELLREVRSDPEEMALVEDLLLFLMEADEAAPSAGLKLLYSLLFVTTDQLGYPEVARLLAHVLDPQRSFAVSSTPDLPLVSHLATLVGRMLELDDQDAGLDLIRRTLAEYAPKDSPLSVLIRVVRDIHRMAPGSADPCSAADLGEIMGALVRFIRDDVRGLERLIGLIQGRGGPAGSEP